MQTKNLYSRLRTPGANTAASIAKSFKDAALGPGGVGRAMVTGKGVICLYTASCT